MSQPPESVQEWIAYARSHLTAARAAAGQSILWAIPCFEAQQAAETAIKGVLIYFGTRPPRIHDIGRLLDLLPPELDTTVGVEASPGLTRYAFVTRYPGGAVPVTEDDYREALRLAEAVVAWADSVIGRKPST
ncbi:MAG: HEPN domain-containing protein [Armatimonadota bacterium]